jgi:hypothetical protein
MIVKPMRKRIYSCGGHVSFGFLHRSLVRGDRGKGGRESYISHGKPVSSQHRQQQDDGYSEKLDETHMALSKNSITPPMRKKPPA